MNWKLILGIGIHILCPFLIIVSFPWFLEVIMLREAVKRVGYAIKWGNTGTLVASVMVARLLMIFVIFIMTIFGMSGGVFDALILVIWVVLSVLVGMYVYRRNLIWVLQGCDGKTINKISFGLAVAGIIVAIVEISMFSISCINSGGC